MKKHIGNLLGFALLMAAASAHAQVTETIQIKVPFQFVAGGKSWPAADYKVRITQPTGLLTISAANVAPAIVMSITNEHPGMEGGKSYAKFERYGDSWVLEEVTYDGTGQVLRQSKFERQLTQVKPTGQQILVASNIAGR